MNPVRRLEGEGKESFFHRIYNSYGHSELRLAYNFTTQDGLFWTKWVRYDQLMSLDYHDRVPGTQDSKETFLAKASHRTIAPCEVIYDFDEPGKDFLTIKEMAKSFYKTHPNSAVYFTGNKSYHINTVVPELVFFNVQRRSEFKARLLSAAGADVQKAGESMIAIEGEPHYRSGKAKSEVCEWYPKDVAKR
jgi:hypothetical protein